MHLGWGARENKLVVIPECYLDLPQAMSRGSKREEPTMRLLRWIMTGVCGLLLVLSAITWYQGDTVVEYTVQQAVAVHFMGHRMYYLEVSLKLRMRCQGAA